MSPFRADCAPASLRSAGWALRPDFVDGLRRLPPIPKVVHVSWKSHDLPRLHAAMSADRLRRLCGPDWELRVYNDTEVDQWLKREIPAADYARLRDRHWSRQTRRP